MKKITIMVAAFCFVFKFASFSWAETINSRIGKLTFTSGYPEKETV
jgi:hypothetical protein